MHFWLKHYTSVNYLTNTLVARLCLFAVLCFSFSLAQAVNISAYRIYLDEENRDVSFVIFNRQSSHQECKLNLIHNNFDADSQLIHLADDVIPENSAKDWIRYSPREFLLTPAQSQTVRFSLRRKANAQEGEYRSYLLIDCGITAAPNDKAAEKPQVSLQTKLVHSVPIIARSGKLEASVQFDNFQLTENGLTFSLQRKGSRSVYGDIEVIDKNTNDKIFTQRNFSIYPESERFNFKIEKKNLDLKNLKFRYIENKEYGGNIVLEQDAR